MILIFDKINFHAEYSRYCVQIWWALIGMVVNGRVTGI